MRMFCAVAVAVLVAANLLNNWFAPGAYVPTCVAATAALLLIARRDGLTRADLGLDAAALRRGLRWAPVLVGAVLAVLLLGLAVPATREAFQNARAAGLSAGQLLWRMLMRHRAAGGDRLPRCLVGHGPASAQYGLGHCPPWSRLSGRGHGPESTAD
ncbi:hypothetical protein [Actinacidiphila soli]|uniref:hypothetical protein n=1 Tax=Actinacidiphila soli TaxID=2487275 RepID=UPI001F0C5C86|nr:hypothetical protein [Actinacidiphila soli]